MRMAQKVWFGRHRGGTILWLINFQPAYALWAHLNVKHFDLTGSQIQFCRDRIASRRVKYVAARLDEADLLQRCEEANLFSEPATTGSDSPQRMEMFPMALKVKGAAAPTPPKDTEFELTLKDGMPTIRAITHDGKKYLLATITPQGIKLRPKNNHADLGVKVDRNGAVAVIA